MSNAAVTLPLYERIRREIQALIETSYQPGDTLPSQQDLARSTGASVITVKRALGELARAGVVESARGRGTTVCRKPVSSQSSHRTRMNTDPFKRIAARMLLPAVANVETPDQAVALARAYLDAGLDVMEITLRRPSSLDCIRAIHAEVPDMLCGAGTVLTPQQVESLAAAGVPFAVSPGFNPTVVRTAHEAGLPFAPGIATPGELEQAIALGCTHVKPFPVESLGGVAFLKALSGPYGHTGIRFIPMGGIRTEDLADYLALPTVAAVGLSALGPANLIREGRWEELSTNIRQLLRQAGT